MPVTGKSPPRRFLSACLDEQILVRLAQDVLFARGHKRIRATDGPGDGGRDVQSLTPRGNCHLVQCKFHGKPDRACSSAEVAELPTAMTKLGYEHGTFVTNARLSPQAKREYLDDYPGLEMEFLDGDALVDEVLGDALLKAIWFDGKEVGPVNSALIFPAIARSHGSDLPITPRRGIADSDLAARLRGLDADFQGYRVEVRGGVHSPELFRPYRPPSYPSIEEGLSDVLHTLEVVVEGDVPLAATPRMADAVARVLVDYLSGTSTGLSVVVGRPLLTVPGGTAEGSRAIDGQGATCYVVTDSCCADFHSFYSHDEAGGPWTAKTSARQTQADLIRLYAPTLDCCVAYETSFRVMYPLNPTRVAMRAIERHGWDRSLFALVPPWEDWPHPFPEPDDWVDWPWDARRVCGWLYGTLLGGLIPIPADGGHGLDTQRDADVHRLAALREQASECAGVDVVSPSDARHMIALAGSDPFPEDELETYHTGEMTVMLEDLPLTVLPSSRRFSLTMVWESSAETGRLRDACIRAAKEVGLPVLGEISVEEDFGYRVVRAQLRPARTASAPTAELTRGLHSRLNSWIEHVETALPPGESLKRASKRYWVERFELILGSSGSDPDT